jgi:hypothetical protein
MVRLAAWIADETVSGSFVADPAYFTLALQIRSSLKNKLLESSYVETHAKKTTLAGLEPTRDKPNRFLVDRLNHSATVSHSGSVPGIEPGTSSTLKTNHTTRPNGLIGSPSIYGYYFQHNIRDWGFKSRSRVNSRVKNDSFTAFRFAFH